MKKVTTILFLQIIMAMISMASYAQTPATPQDLSQNPRVNTQRKSFWFETNFFGSITPNKRLQYQVDYQYRRMADASYIKGGDHGNIFKDPYQQVFRPWIHFWAIPGSLRLSLSPIGLWYTYTPSAEGSLYSTPQTQSSTGANQNTNRSIYPEFRICPQITLSNNYGRFKIVNRMRYEIRFIGERHATSGNFFNDMSYGYDFYPNPQGQGFGSSHQGRLRWQMRVQFALNKKKIQQNALYIDAWNELFVAMGKHVNYNKMLNQDRVVALLGFQLPTKYPIRIETGITYQTVFLYNIGVVPTQPDVTYNKQNVEQNLAYTTYLIFDEFHSIFKKKKKEPPLESK